MAMTASEMSAVLCELSPALTSGWVQKIGEPAPDVIVLDIRTPGRTIRLLISIDPDHARLHILTKPHPNPSVPPSFCQLLRSRLMRARLDRVAQINDDRIIRFDFAAAGGATWSLVAELLGRHTDLLLLDKADMIVATYRQAIDRIGHVYGPPSRPTAQPVARPVLPTRAAPTGTLFPLSAEIEERYGALEEALRIERAAHARKQFLRKAIKKQQRLISALGTDLTKAAQYEHYARYGELLKSALGGLKKGQPSITLVDYFDERLPELTIPLDPAKNPQSNMDAYFAKHKKFLTANKELIPRIESIRREVQALEKELHDLEHGTWQPTQAPPLKSGDHSGRRSLERGKDRRGPFRRFTSADGLPIYVGRNARENDELTFRFAKSDDLWLHAQGAPGSHVVVRVEKGSDPPNETLRDAATLALLYSDLKKAGKGDVIYTRRKWVHKAKGAALGSVIVTQEKTLFIRLEKARLDTLRQRSL